MIKKILTYLSLTLIFSNLQALIYQIDIYKSPQGAMTYLCKDEHTNCTDDSDSNEESDDDKETAGEKRLKAITTILDAYKNKAKIILECNADYQGSDAKLKKYIDSTRESNMCFGDSHLLLEIFSYCVQRNISFINVDHRTLNQFSLEHGNVPIKVVLESFDAVAKEIQGYKSESLKNFYQDTVDLETVLSKNFINRLRAHRKETLKELHERIGNEKMKEKFYKKADTFGDHFLDARLIHQLENHKTTDPIFAFLGGWHIDNIEKYLPKIGYIYLGSLGQEPEHEEDGSIITGSILDIEAFSQAITNPTLSSQNYTRLQNLIDEQKYIDQQEQPAASSSSVAIQTHAALASHTKPAAASSSCSSQNTKNEHKRKQPEPAAASSSIPVSPTSDDENPTKKSKLKK